MRPNAGIPARLDARSGGGPSPLRTEGEGFEPPVGSRPQRLSRPPHSTALPPLPFDGSGSQAYETWRPHGQRTAGNPPEGHQRPSPSTLSRPQRRPLHMQSELPAGG